MLIQQIGQIGTHDYNENFIVLSTVQDSKSSIRNFFVIQNSSVTVLNFGVVGIIKQLALFEDLLYTCLVSLLFLNYRWTLDKLLPLSLHLQEAVVGNLNCHMKNGIIQERKKLAAAQ
ncbi:hypothetical protein ACJX0J_030023 [Zea mays]